MQLIHIMAFYLGVALLKECCIDMVKADLVIQSGGDQGEHQGQEIDDDGDAPGPEHEHLLNLDPFELGDVVSGKL